MSSVTTAERRLEPALALVLVGLAFGPSGCATKRESAPGPAVDSASNVQNSALSEESPSAPVPRMGMVYVPPGALVVGTPIDRRPRRPDRELAGEQVMLEGFYMDQLAYPNEEGAIPLTNVSQDEAAALCEGRGKRLCTELEWERACKGPDNRTFEYGDVYRADTCRTGRPAELRPSGYLVGCQSDFGVRDLHGGPFEWTSSDFGRRTNGLVTVRGGNGVPGEVFGRCANAEALPSGTKSGTVGFRCCAGPANALSVELREFSTPGLFPLPSGDEARASLLLEKLPEATRRALEVGGTIRRERAWSFVPVPNEELLLVAACGRGKPRPSCGLVVGRVAPGSLEVLGFVETGRVVPALHRPGPRELVWVVGGDLQGATKRLLSYRFGEVQVGEFSRGLPKKAPRVK